MWDRGKDGLDKREGCGVIIMFSICDLFQDYWLPLLIHSCFPALFSFPVFIVSDSRKSIK